MKDVNNCHLTGRLVTEPELVLFGDEKRDAVCRFRMSVTRGEDRDYFDVVCWGKLAELCAENLTKGSFVYVSGEVHVREITARVQDAEVKRYRPEITAREVVFLGRNSGV